MPHSVAGTSARPPPTSSAPSSGPTPVPSGSHLAFVFPETDSVVTADRETIIQWVARGAAAQVDL